MISQNAVFEGPGVAVLAPQELSAPGPGELQCRALLSLISVGTEVRCLRGVFDEGTNWKSWVQYPFRPGYSMAAEVMAVGEGVLDYAPGDRIFAHAPHSQFFNVSVKLANHLPEGISSEEAVWTTMARTTQNAVRRAQIQLGDTVAVIGGGIVGVLSMQYAKIAGADRLIMIDRNEARLQVARRLGATHTIKAHADGALQELLEISCGRLADVVFDATGNPATLAQACPLVRKNGKILLVGDTTEPHKQALGPGVLSGYLTIMGAHSQMFVQEESPFFPYTWQRIHQIFYDYVAQGRMDVAGMTELTISPAELPELYMKLLDKTSLAATAILVDWSRLR